jgi:hypothetical protein
LGDGQGYDKSPGRAPPNAARSRLRGGAGWPHYIEKINGPFLYVDRGTPAEYSAKLKFAIERGWLELHDSGTFVRFTQSGADLFA